MTIQYERRTTTARRRPACGAPMRDGERCARTVGHNPRWGHRSAYSLDNLRIKRHRERRRD